MPAYPRILVAEARRFPPAAIELLRQTAHVTLEDLDRPGLLEAVADADVLWVRLGHYIDEEVLAAGPALRWIATPTTGLAHIDLGAAHSRGIEVVSLRGRTDFLRDIRATAEHAVAMALALLRHLPAAAAHVCRGGWDRDLFVGSELYRRTVGIVGYGRLGRIVARYMQTFDARVLAADPALRADEIEEGVSLVPLEDLLQQSDIVSLHVDLRPETRLFFGADCFARMRAGSWFINTARGELVDEGSLLQALRSGHLSGAAIDVLADEQRRDIATHPLVEYARNHSNLLVTPHIGGCTGESMRRAEVHLAQVLAQVLSNAVDLREAPVHAGASTGS